jgi:hypothetical protein
LKEYKATTVHCTFVATFEWYKKARDICFMVISVQLYCFQSECVLGANR